MALTTAQLQALKTDINADASFNTLKTTPDGRNAIAAAYNAAASPDFWVWRTAVTENELVNTTSVDGTTFNWTGAGFISRTVGEQTAWARLFGISGSVNPSLANVRQAFADILSGATAPAPANRTHLLTIARRKATRLEKLFATGTGSTASPGTMGFEGSISYTDIEAALNA